MSTRPSLRFLLGGWVLALLLGSGVVAAQTPAQPPAQATAPATSQPPLKTRSTALPSKGLFVGDQLSDAARARLTEFVIDAIGQQIEVALVVPHGAWNAEGSGKDERDLTPARLQAVRKFLGDRGIDAKRIFVESRIDHTAKEARLEIQTVSRPATD
jgi:OmpA-OmpF porin, OOP family